MDRKGRVSGAFSIVFSRIIRFAPLLPKNVLMDVGLQPIFRL